MIPLYGTLSMFTEPVGPSSSRRHLSSRLTASSKAWLRLLRQAGGATDPCSSPTGSLVKKRRKTQTPLTYMTAPWGWIRGWAKSSDLNSSFFADSQVESLCLIVTSKRFRFAFTPMFFICVGQFPLILCVSFPPCFPPSLPPSGSLSALWLRSFESECCRLSLSLSTPSG